MSRNAAAACATARVPCWAVRRAPWRRQAGDDWRDARDWADLERLIAPFERPLWTLGREPLAHLNEIPASQYWTVRCLDPQPPHTPDHARAAILDARGPFALDAERALFIERNIDVLISKNSGGAATEAKLAVARELGVPVVMLARPDLPAVDREFDDATAARVALAAWLDPAQLTE
jgi:precorrin-6A/cobalt-precorrin-6A reductase